MNVSQLITLSRNERQKFATEVILPLVLKKIHREYIDPIHFTEVVTAWPEGYRQIFEIEKQKIKLQRQQDGVAEATAAAEKPKARREAKLIIAKQKIAELQRDLEKAQAAAVAVSKEDSELIDVIPQRLRAAASGTAALINNSMETGLWRLINEAVVTAPAELFEEGATA